MQWRSDSSERPAQEFSPFSHHQFLKCATTAWNQGDMNHTQRKTIKNQPRSQDRKILVGFIPFFNVLSHILLEQPLPMGGVWVDASTAGKRGHTGQPVRAGSHLTSRMGTAVSWMDRMWLMLCCASSFSSCASANQRRRWPLENLLPSIYIQCSWKTNANLGIFHPTTAPSLNCPRQTWPSG